MNNFLPDIGSSGIYTLLEPFQNDLLANTNYTCIAIRKFADIAVAGGDVYNDYYLPKSISKVVYQSDLENGACILTLQTNSGRTTHVPSSYLKTYPASGGKAYHVVALAINIGAIPDELDLTLLKLKIAELVKDTVGIQNASVKSVLISDKQLVTNQTHAALEAARQANITNSTTDRSKLTALTAELAAVRQRNEELEAWIVANA